MKNALQSLLSLSFIGGAALYLCPEGGVRRVLKILCAAMFAAAVLAPIREFDYDLLSLEQARIASAEAEIGRKAEATEDRLKKLLLQENCERYIVNRGRELGLAISSAAVELGKSESGEWLPCAVSIRAAGEAAAAERLCRLIRDELGIPTERQVWSLNE